jgi:hypothetical protein
MSAHPGPWIAGIPRALVVSPLRQSHLPTLAPACILAGTTTRVPTDYSCVTGERQRSSWERRSLHGLVGEGPSLSSIIPGIDVVRWLEAVRHQNVRD